jgi:hypothetical protein
MRDLKVDMAVIDPEYDDEDDRWKPQKERVRNLKAQFNIRHEGRK